MPCSSSHFIRQEAPVLFTFSTAAFRGVWPKAYSPHKIRHYKRKDHKGSFGHFMNITFTQLQYQEISGAQCCVSILSILIPASVKSYVMGVRDLSEPSGFNPL